MTGFGLGVRGVGVVLVFAGAIACTGATDLGADCTLVKRNPDGGTLAVAVTEGELPTTPSDYISFGSPLCLDACVRDSNVQKSGNNNAPASGYCSHACGSDADCGKGYACKSLLLDQATLEAICNSDPSKCRSFGGDPHPLYCVKVAS